MINSKIKKYLDECEPLSLDEEDYVFDEGFQTGSSVFGGPFAGTDIDLILPPSCDTQEFHHKFAYTGGSIGEGDTFHSVYVKTEDGDVLNLLYMNNEHEYLVWKRATIIMIKIDKIPKMHKMFKMKSRRIEFFEMLRRYLYEDENLKCEEKVKAKQRAEDIFDPDLPF